METQVEQLDGDRVRLTVEVPAGEVQHAVEHATHDLADRVKIPGFRAGKVPPQVLVSRLGKERLYSEAVESHIDNWFWSAARSTRVRPSGRPDFNYELPQADDRELDVHRRVPRADRGRARRLDGARGAEARGRGRGRGRRRPARGAPGDGRHALAGRGPPGAQGRRRRRRHRLGLRTRAARLRRRARRGTARRRDRGRDPRPAARREPAGQLGARRQLRARRRPSTLKELHEKVLPPRDDDFARSASEFDTLDELRADIVERITMLLEQEAESRFRIDAVDELAQGLEGRARRPRRRGAHARADQRLHPPARVTRDRPRRLPADDGDQRRRAREDAARRGRALDRARARARGRRRQARHRGDRRRHSQRPARRRRVATRRSRSSSPRAGPTASATTCA